MSGEGIRRNFMPFATFTNLLDKAQLEDGSEGLVHTNKAADLEDVVVLLLLDLAAPIPG